MNLLSVHYHDNKELSWIQLKNTHFIICINQVDTLDWYWKAVKWNSFAHVTLRIKLSHENNRNMLLRCHFMKHKKRNQQNMLCTYNQKVKKKTQIHFHDIWIIVTTLSKKNMINTIIIKTLCYNIIQCHCFKFVWFMKIKCIDHIVPMI